MTPLTRNPHFNKLRTNKTFRRVTLVLLMAVMPGGFFLGFLAIALGFLRKQKEKKRGEQKDKANE